MNTRKRSTSLILAAAALAGLGSFAPPQSNPAPSVPNNRPQITRAASQAVRPVAAKTQTPQLSSGLLSLLNSGGAPGGFFKSGGTPPDVWGRSDACRRMVRHNRLRRAGIGGARI